MSWFSRKTKVQATPPERKFSGVMVGMGQAKWTQHSFRKLAYEGFETNPVVYACVTKLAKALSSVDLHLYDYTRWGDLRKIERHGILELVNRPNSMWSGRQFLEKLATQYLIGGNSYLLGNNGPERQPSELWLLPPEYITVDAARGRMLPDGYTYRPGSAGPVIYPVNPVTGRSAVCHLRTVNPLNEWYGLPPLAAAAHGVDIFNSGQAWNMALLQNEGRPSGALQQRQSKDGSVPPFSDDQYARLKDEMDAFTGSHNAGRPLLLDSQLEWVQMSLNSKDMDHRETMLTNARFIAACYGTPPQLVNIPGESTYSNYQQATMAYWGDTVLPLLGILLEDINRWLAPLFGEKVFLWYDEEQIPALEPRRKEKFDRVEACTFMTKNEKREAVGMEAYEPPAKPGADSMFVRANEIPIELAGEVDPNIHPALAEDPPPDPNQPPAEPGKKPETQDAGKKPAKSVE